MTGEMTESKMLEIVSLKKAEIQKKIDLLDNTQTTAKKTYLMLMGFLGQAEKMVCMTFSDRAYDEKYYSVRKNRVFKAPGELLFADREEWFDGLRDKNQQEAFLVYAHAVQMVYSAFYVKRLAELNKAKEQRNIEKEFENSVIVDQLEELLNEWKVWWNEAQEGNQ